MMQPVYRYCPQCASVLARITLDEDGGPRERLRCPDPGCGWTHWNNPTPVLAAVIEYQDKVFLARNAAWPGKMFALITGFMEARETPEQGIVREIGEETGLSVSQLDLIGVYDFQRMNQVIIAYHALAHGSVTLSPELVEWRLYGLDEVRCWPAGTGHALADWLRSRGHEPRFREFAKGASSSSDDRRMEGDKG